MGRNLLLIRELDAQSQNLLAHIATLNAEISRQRQEKAEQGSAGGSSSSTIAAAAAVASGGEASVAPANDQQAAADGTLPLVLAARQELKEAKDLSEEKVALATQTYDLVDKHIRKLDAELRQFESENDVNSAGWDAEGAAAAVVSTGGAITPTGKRRMTNTGSLGPTSKKGKGASAASAGAPLISTSPAPGSSGARRKGPTPAPDVSNNARTRSSAELDMPVDPNEPRYCICQKWSFGQMIACDNPNCKIEWFHYSCVGLTSAPKGNWYCPDCRQHMGRTK